MWEHVCEYWFWYIYPVGGIICAMAVIVGKICAQKDKDFKRLSARYVCKKCGSDNTCVFSESGYRGIIPYGQVNSVVCKDCCYTEVYNEMEN